MEIEIKKFEFQLKHLEDSLNGQIKGVKQFSWLQKRLAFFCSISVVLKKTCFKSPVPIERKFIVHLSI
jgi:hypothetical protein